MKTSIIGLCLFMMSVQLSFAQQKDTVSKAEQEIISLSKEKWQWMADDNVDRLTALFHDKSKFVYMSGTFGKDKELDIIKNASSWYKDPDIHDISAAVIDDVAIVWSRITLNAPVGVKDAVTEFTVTEVYKKQKKEWKLLTLTFSSVHDTHAIKH